MTHLLNRSSFGDPANAGNLLSREDSFALLNDWVINDRLRLHMRQVAHLMKVWAESHESLKGEDPEKWFIAGLLHDADWDQWPDDHCKIIIDELEKRKIDPDIIHAIASHGHRYFGVIPVSRMDKMLYAFDELSGFVHAYSLMRPGGYEGMEVKGVMKRLKDKTFAAGVSREDVTDAANRIEIPVEELIRFIITHQSNNPPGA